MGVDREHLRQSYNRNANTRATHPLPRWRILARDEWISTLREAGARSIVDLGGQVFDDVAFWTEQSGFRPELHYQRVQARVPERDVGWNSMSANRQ